MFFRRKFWGRLMVFLFGHVKAYPKSEDPKQWNLLTVSVDDLEVKIDVCKFTGELFVSDMRRGK